jgi:hypothetical protein
MGVADLSAVLWRERHLLELLLFKLEVERLVLSSGRGRWVWHATREVEQVLGQIRTAELDRAVEADATSRALGIEPGSRLLALAQAAPEPWAELLASHRDAFLGLTAEIDDLADANRELLASSHRAAQETIVGLRESMATDTSSGTGSSDALAGQSDAGTIIPELATLLTAVDDADLAASLVELELQEIAYEAALGATGRPLQPTLLDFLA